MQSEVNIREAIVEDAPELARILTRTNRATFEGLVPDYCLDSPTLAESERNWRRFLTKDIDESKQFLLVIENESGQLVGYILAGGATDRETEAELNVLMIDTPWQRQGYGRLLINEGANRLKNRGAKSILIAVEQHNPNRAFYEHLVANQFGEKPLDWDGYQTKLILYRWENLDELCRLTSA